MISLSYSCAKCGFKSAILNDAQDHSNKTAHHVVVGGFITPTIDLRSKELRASDELVQKTREALILRTARDRGLLK